MALDIKQYFFDSIDPSGDDPGDERIYPADEFVQGALAALVTNGIYNGGDNCKIIPTEYNYTVAMKPGRAYIEGYNMNAIEAYGDEDVRHLLAVPQPTGTIRCDRVVIRLNRDMSLEGRYIKPMVIAGTEGSEDPPDLVRTAEIYDLSLATVTVRQNTAVIPEEDITDTRFDGSVCGVAGFKPQPDLTDLVQYFYNLWSTEYAEALESLETGISLQIVTTHGATTSNAITITNTTASTSETTGALIVSGGVGVSGTIYADKVYGAVWNDYAEYRKAVGDFSPGDCVCEGPDGRLRRSTRRRQKCAHIVSDTFGFAIGQSDDARCPIALMGRVLAKTDGKRYKVGDVLCAGTDGKATKMRWWERVLCPDRIVGIVSGIPTEDEWGDGNVKINGRIWVNVR